jgi:hypothetical protein
MKPVASRHGGGRERRRKQGATAEFSLLEPAGFRIAGAGIAIAERADRDLVFSSWSALKNWTPSVGGILMMQFVTPE